MIYGEVDRVSDDNRDTRGLLVIRHDGEKHTTRGAGGGRAHV